MKLFFRQQGQGKPLIILHGLLGSSDNWHSLGKLFAETFSVYIVDQRNHGQSPHSDEFNYKVLTEDLEEFIKENKIGYVVILRGATIPEDLRATFRNAVTDSKSGETFAILDMSAVKDIDVNE